ncbi:hypothetical protein TBK1r_38350 [Stieleria magnilauensis]|uniref:Uncharacterized protein n=1 Tax=Stieleria magnilauensis TaxID=2527963 RepID=A0ABX5XSB3_9BACT|nr:hypothetical protein TBK1r_38350 [Planctomycetes bacterium TBK1r]
MGGGPPLSRTIPTRPHCNSSARIEYVGMGVPTAERWQETQFPRAR